MDTDALLRENDELRRKLELASQTIDAIVRGEIDTFAQGEGRNPVLLHAAQERLREREALFRAVFDGALDAMLLAGDDGRCVDANPAACALFGVPRDEILGKRPNDFKTTPPPRPSGGVVGMGTERGGFTVRRPDGTVRELEGGATANILPGLHLSVLRDVTAQNEAQRAVAASEARFRAMLDNSAEAIALAARDGTLHYASASIERILGFRADELVTRPGCDWVDERDRSRVASKIAAHLSKSSHSAQIDFRARHRDGSVRWLEATVTNLLANPAVGAIVANVRDVTDSHRAAEALRESEQRYREVVENSPEPILVHVAHRIAFANEATARFLGVRDPASLIGRSVLEFVHPESFDDAKARLDEVLEMRVPVPLTEQRYIREDDGRIMTVEIASIPMVRDGAPAMLSIARDVTLRKEAERDASRALTEAMLERRKLETILAALPVGVWIADAGGGLLQTNPAAEQIWGGRAPLPSDPAGYHEYKGFSPVTGQLLASDQWALARTLRTGETIIAEPVDIERFDGSRGHILNSTAPIKDDEGRIIGGVVVCLDVTERQEAARERERLIASLEYERSRLGALLEKAPAFIAVLRTKDLVFEIVNDALYDVVGKRPLIGKPLAVAVPEAEAQGFIAILAEVLATGQPFAARGLPALLARRPNEPLETRFVNVVFQALVESDGERTGVFVHGVDVTDETTAQRRVQAQFNGVPVPTYAWEPDREAANELVLVDCNDAARKVEAGRIDALMGKRATDVYADDSSIVADLQRCLQTQETFERETDYTRKTTGESLRLHVTYAFAPPNIVLAHMEDISERRKLEEQLRQAQKMDAVGRLAGGVAHDFNNILSVILTYAEFFLEDLKAGDPMRGDVEEMRDSARRAVDLTSQLLAFSRQQVLAPRVVDLGEIVGGLEKMLGRLLGEDVELVIHLEKNLTTVFADPGQVEQVVMNLVVNARDAMPGGGRLSIDVANVELDEAFVAEHLGARPGYFVMIAVTDTGIGMDRKTLARIFEPFFTTKEAGKGTGLGLSTVFGVVHQSGGYVSVDSAPGRGTTFRVYLPRSIEATTSLPPRATSPVVTGGEETILLVEDEDAVRHVARTILRRAGYSVLEAQNGGEAFLICEQHNGPIALLLTDVVMPRMSGRHVAERIEAARPNLKVLFMSGYTDDAVVHHGVFAAEVAFIQKPITPDTLLRKVREVLDGPQRSLPPRRAAH